MSKDMNGEKYNWPRCCKVLGEKVPDVLIGVDKEVIDCFVREKAKGTDEFLSYDTEYVLSEAAADFEKKEKGAKCFFDMFDMSNPMEYRR